MRKLLKVDYIKQLSNQRNQRNQPNIMAIQNMPFVKNDQPFQRKNYEEEKGTLSDAKKMIPQVSQINFKNACISARIPHYLHDLYYMHYLVIIGDVVRARNFVRDLEERNMDIEKLVNYNREPRFNYGSVLHTCASWNRDTRMIEFLFNECEGDFEVDDRFGLCVCDITCQTELYLNPFLDILGHGERPFNQFDIKRRDHSEFIIVDRYLKNIRNVLDEREEEEEDLIIENNAEPQPPALQRQHAVILGENLEPRREPPPAPRRPVPQPRINAPDYIPLPELEDGSETEPESESEVEEEEEFVLGINGIHVNRPAFQEENQEQNQEEVELVVPLQPRRLNFDEQANEEEHVEEQEMDEEEMSIEEINERVNRFDNRIMNALEQIFASNDKIDEKTRSNIKKAIARKRISTYEDFIHSKLFEGDLEVFGVPEHAIITVWDYIEARSPNFVNGSWDF